MTTGTLSVLGTIFLTAFIYLLFFELLCIYYWTPNNLLKTYFEWRKGEHYYA